MTMTEETWDSCFTNFDMNKNFIDYKEWRCYFIYYLGISSENEITYVTWNIALWSNKEMIWPLCTVEIISGKYIIIIISSKYYVIVQMINTRKIAEVGKIIVLNN